MNTSPVPDTFYRGKCFKNKTLKKTAASQAGWLVGRPITGVQLLYHGIVSAGRGQHRDAQEVAGLVLVGGRGHHGGGEGQLVVLQDGQAVLGLLLLQVEHLPQLLELLQLAEGLQHHQHHHQAQQQVHWQHREKAQS